MLLNLSLYMALKIKSGIPQGASKKNYHKPFVANCAMKHFPLIVVMHSNLLSCADCMLKYISYYPIILTAISYINNRKSYSGSVYCFLPNENDITLIQTNKRKKKLFGTWWKILKVDQGQGQIYLSLSLSLSGMNARTLEYIYHPTTSLYYRL